MDKKIIVLIAFLSISILVLIISLCATFYPTKIRDMAIYYTGNNKGLIEKTEKKLFLMNSRICGVFGILLSLLIIYLAFYNFINPKINKNAKKIENIK